MPVPRRKRCTSAISLDIDGLEVPIGTRQKSTVQNGGVSTSLALLSAMPESLLRASLMSDLL